MRKLACKAEADTVSVIAVSEPNFLSDCYRIKARLYKTGQSLSGSEGRGARQNKIHRLIELQSLREKGALSEEEFQRLKREIIEEGD